MSEWFATHVTFGNVVGLLSLTASVFALLAAQTARQVARETREQVGQARLSFELGKLQGLVLSLRRSVTLRNWDYASEKCADIVAQQAEIINRFSRIDEIADIKDFERFASQIRSIGGKCAKMEEEKIELGVAKIVAQIDKQLEFLSAIYGASQQQLEAQIVKR